MTMLELPPVKPKIPVGYYEVGAPPEPPLHSLPSYQEWMRGKPMHPEIIRPTDEQIANTLDRTRRIVKRGWMQGARHFRGKRCLLGALQYAIYGRDDGMVDPTNEQARLHRACLMVLSRACDPHLTTEWWTSMTGAMTIYQWNDAPGRTKRQVCRMLKQQVQALR